MNETEEITRYLDKLCCHKLLNYWEISVTGKGIQCMAIEREENGFTVYEWPIGRRIGRRIRGYELLELLANEPVIANKLAEPIE